MSELQDDGLIEVTVDKLVHGGQGIGRLPDGRKVLIWGALPGEKARVRLIKSKNSYAEGIAEVIVEASLMRAQPREANHLATSPWQIIAFTAENDYKKHIVHETFAQAGVSIPDFNLTTAGDEWHYRNKMEYSFWGDDDGLHLAQYQRGSHQKAIVLGSALAMPAIDKAACAILGALRQLDVRAGDLKTIIVRCDQSGAAVAALFVKPASFAKLPLPEEVKGLRVYHSNPKSPASVPTKLLYELGDVRLHDVLGGRSLAYDVDSFFQVNLPVFEKALARIKEKNADADRLVDMYAGVGGIGLCAAKQSVELVELDRATAAMARVNAAAATDLKATVVEAPAERAVERIVADSPVSFDPPRAGLHDHVVDRIMEVKPPRITYLSCNPITQARDLAKLQTVYAVTHFEGFNFFPHTPHIETLAILERRK